MVSKERELFFNEIESNKLEFILAIVISPRYFLIILSVTRILNEMYCKLKFILYSFSLY